MVTCSVQSEVRVLPLSQVVPDPEQHRKVFNQEALSGLAESLLSLGQQSPITVFERADGLFQIVAGERRYRACKLAGIPSIRAEVRELSMVELASLQAAENLARVDVTPVEKARACQRIIDEFLAAAGANDEATRRQAKRHAAKVTGSDLGTMTWRLRLLELPEEVLDMVNAGAICESYAIELTRLLQVPGDNQAEQVAYAVSLARRGARGMKLAEVKARISAYIGEAEQCTLFDMPTADPGEVKAARNKLTTALGHFERGVEILFDEKEQCLTIPSGIRKDELETCSAKLELLAGYVAKLMAAVNAAADTAREMD